MRARKNGRDLAKVLWDVLRAGAVDSSRLQLPSLVLLVLSLGDIFVTFLLLNRGQGFYESNPIAEWFLARWSFRGMFLFKLGTIVVAITLGEIIERYRPGWGRVILWLGCLVSLTVVWHGLRLYLGLPGLSFWGLG